MPAALDWLGVTELCRLIAARQVSPVEVTRRALDKAEATQASLNCFAHLMPEQALAEARRAEDAVMAGAPLGLPHGVPYTSGSRAMAGTLATVNARAVGRVRAAGAVVIGKTTTSEFGCKPVGDSPLTGVPAIPGT